MPLLVVAQTARAAEEPRPGRPKRQGRDWEGAAKDSGEVETDSSTLLYLQSDPCPQNGTSSAHLHLSKSRGSPANVVIPIRFNGALGLFSDERLRSGDAALVLDAIKRLRPEGGRIGINKLQDEMSWGAKRVRAALGALQSLGDIETGANGARLAAGIERP
jgi:hypothetical protein